MKLKMGLLGLAATAVLATSTPAWASLNTDLCSASAGGDFSSVMAAVQLGASPNTRDRAGRPPLSWAARNGHLRVVAYLVEHGAYVDATDAEGYTALMWAARAGQFEVVSYLAGRGANPNYRNWSGEDAYQLSRYGRDWRVTDLLWRYSHGEMVGFAPKAKRPNPVLGMAMTPPAAKPPAATPPAAKPPAAKPPAVKPVEKPAAAAPVEKPVAAGPVEPNPILKAMTYKKLAEAGARATTDMEALMKTVAGNPMALGDPDIMLGKDLLNMYANSVKTQNLINTRAEWKMVKEKMKADSKFAKNLADVDLILQEAGL